jgi:hypothetical protein
MPLNLDKLIKVSAMTSYLDGNAEPLIKFLRGERALTPELRNFIADILEGKIKKKRGRKKDFANSGAFAMCKVELPATMQMLKAINSYDPKQGFDAYREALEILAERYELTPDQLDKVIYPRKRKKMAEKRE